MPTVPAPPSVEEFFQQWAQEQVDAVAPDCTQEVADAVAPLNAQITTLTAERDDLQSQLIACQGDLTGTQQSLADKQIELEAANAALAQANADNQVLQNEVNALTTERNNLLVERDALQDQVGSLSTQVATLQSQLVAVIQERDDLQDEVALLEQDLADCQAQGGGDPVFFPIPNLNTGEPWFDLGFAVAINPDFANSGQDVSSVVEDAQLVSQGGKPWVILPHGVLTFNKDGTTIFDSGRITGGIQAGKANAANGTVCDYRGPSGGTLFKSDRNSDLTQFGISNLVVFATNDLDVAIDIVQLSNSGFIRDIVFRSSGGQRRINIGVKLDNKDSLGVDGDDNALFKGEVENLFFNNGAGNTAIWVRGWVNGLFNVIDVNNWLQVMNHIRGSSGQSNGVMASVKHHNLKEPIDASVVLDNMNGNPWTFVGANVQHTRGVETFVRVVNDTSRQVAILGGNKTPEGQNNGHPNLQNWIIGAGETVPAVDGETIYYPNPLSAEAALALQNL